MVLLQEDVTPGDVLRESLLQEYITPGRRYSRKKLLQEDVYSRKISLLGNWLGNRMSNNYH